MSEGNSEQKRARRPRPDGSGIGRRDLWLGLTSLIAASALASTALPHTAAAAPEDRGVLPAPQPPFRGKIGRTAQDSVPDFPKGIEAPAGAPTFC